MSPRSPRQDGVPKRCAILSLLATAARSPATLTLTTLAVANPADRSPGAPQDLVSVLMACSGPSAVHPALQWEACAVLRVLCQHRAAELPLRWPDVQSLVWAHVDRVAEATSGPPTPSRRGSRGPASSASMPEKVANQAVRLAGDFAFASCKQACEAEPPLREQRLRPLAAEFMSTMVACAERVAVPAVRSAAYAALAATPAELWAVLPGSRVEREVEAMRRVVEGDSVPAVRAHAVAAAATAVSPLSTLSDAPGAWSATAAALLHACQDSAASVRAAAAVAIARVCVQLRLLAYPDDGDAGAVDGTSWGFTAPTLHRSAPDRPDMQAPACCSAVPVAAVLRPEAWGSLRDASLACAQGGDKTSAHGLRALGCLSALLPVEDTDVANSAVSASHPTFAHRPVEPDGADAWRVWLAEALLAMRQGLSSGGAKSAWNACIAASQVFTQSTHLHGLVELSALEDLHDAVLAALRGSRNFKVRIHAARALRAAGATACRGGVICTLQPVIEGLRAVEAEGAGGGGPGGGGEGGAGGDGEAPGRPDPEVHFKYHGELRESLTAVLVELLAACTPAEVEAAAGDLEWVLDFLDGQVAAWSVLSIADAASDQVGVLHRWV